jgi:hypothetical protein
LQAVVDAMVHLAEEKILLPQQFILLAFQRSVIGDIFDRYQQAAAVVALIKDLSGVQQHRAAAECREIPLHLEFFDLRVMRDDRREQAAQRWNVPLAIAQLIKQTAHGFLSGHPESAIKCSAGNDNAQRAVEHEERFADGVHDRLFQAAALVGADHKIGLRSNVCKSTPTRLRSQARLTLGSLSIKDTPETRSYVRHLSDFAPPGGRIAGAEAGAARALPPRRGVRGNVAIKIAGQQLFFALRYRSLKSFDWRTWLVRRLRKF